MVGYNLCQTDSFAFHEELASEIAGSLGFLEILKILETSKKLHEYFIFMQLIVFLGKS